MTEDRELDHWRETWTDVPGVADDFQHRIQRRIKRQNLRFVVGNVVAAAGFAGILVSATLLREQLEFLGTGWPVAIATLVAVAVTCRLWILRGSWRCNAETTRDYLELWRRRLLARIRLFRLGVILAGGWLICCMMLAAANWEKIQVGVHAHPDEWRSVLLVCVLTLPAMAFGAVRWRRRSQAELHDLEQLLVDLND